jgi:hypothetical protein
VRQQAAVDKSSYRRYPHPFQRQHQDTVSVADPAVLIRHVAAERGLAVRPGGHQPRTQAGAVSRALPQEARDRRVPLVLQRGGRHGEPGVVGEQRDHASDVIVGVGRREPLRQVAFPRGPRQRRAVTVAGRQHGRHRDPGPLQRAVHRRLAGLQDARDLRGPEAEGVA